MTRRQRCATTASMRCSTHQSPIQDDVATKRCESCVVIGWLAAQYGSVSNAPIIDANSLHTASELTLGIPLLAPEDKAVRSPRPLNVQSGLEAIVDRVLLAGQGSFELFYRAG